MILEKLFARFVAAPLTLHPDTCVVNRNKKADCRKCVQACPKGLLKIGQNGLSGDVDLAECDGCGLCATVCPNGVFEIRKPGDIDILEMIELVLKKKDKLVIGCQGGDKANIDGCDLTVTCHGRLNESIFVAASTMGAHEIQLINHDCNGCGKGDIMPIIRNSIENSRILLDAFGKKLSVVFSEKPVETAQRAVADTLHLPEAVQGRREFLKIIKGNAFATAATVAEGAIDEFKSKISPSEKLEKSVRLDRRLPAKRQILLFFLNKLGEPQKGEVIAPNLPMAQICIEEKCSLCGRCSMFCPTGALHAISTDGKKAIDFSLSLCTGCGVCALVCSEGALRLSNAIRPSALFESTNQCLVHQNTYTCSICRQEFGSPEPRELCQYCERKMKLRNTPW